MSVPSNTLSLPGAPSGSAAMTGGPAGSSAAAVAAVHAAANQKLAASNTRSAGSSSSRGKKWSRSAPCSSLMSASSCGFITSPSTSIALHPSSSVAPPSAAAAAAIATTPAAAACSSTNSSGASQGTIQLPSPQLKNHHGQVTTGSDLILQMSLNAHGNHMADGDSVVKAAITKVLNCSTNGIATNRIARNMETPDP